MRLILLLAALLLIGSANAAPVPALTIVPAPHLNVYSPNRADAILGNVSLLDTHSVTGTVTLANMSEKPVTITRVETSCGCTTAVIGGGGHVPLVVEPHAAITVSASIEASHLVPGDFRKTVSIESTSGDTEIALSGYAIGPAQFIEDEVSFGRVPFGVASRKVTALVDRRAIDIPLRLISGERNVVVAETRELPPSKTDPPNIGKRIEYTLRIAPMPRIGAMSGLLSLMPEKATTSGGVAYPSVDLPVTGTVGPSDLSVNPPQVVFGLVPPKKVQTMTVTLGSSKRDCSRLRVRSRSKLVTWTPIPSSKGTQARALSGIVTLSPNVPRGDFDGLIEITLPGGQRYSMPVSATVSDFAAGNRR